MTAKELIAQLQKLPPETEIFKVGPWDDILNSGYYDQINKVEEITVPAYKSKKGELIPFQSISSLPKEGSIKLVVID